MAIFLYGTLRHLPLLAIVLGRDPGPNLREATLHDHAVHWAAGQSFPMIQPENGAQAQGLLLDGLTTDDQARLDFYEGGFGYQLRPVTVQTGQGAAEALVYFPDPGLRVPAAPWDLQDWVARDGAIALGAATEVMERMGHNSAQEVARIFPAIRARAWARIMGARGAPTTVRRDARREDIEISPRPTGFDGFFRVKHFDLRHRTFSGGQSNWFQRETFVAFDAALVLPYDPETDQVLLIEQLRYGPIWRDDPVPWTLEPIAGLVDAGEPPADTARREAVEEAGLQLGDLQRMFAGYPSPGYSSEHFHCFLGICDLGKPLAENSGLDDENEDIRSHILPFERALALIDSGEITAMPLTAMLLWLARHRDHLRASA
ncbi:gamma-glutamylcyclotransferase [Lutimaribacter sp. EGI FJ00015]|uniref:Gamma-glutamylcyclotransferase n=1 Tax=Lutimaribacter degradans TaxID=2945989 RepID=A0ACC5ZVY0_9RHOB|nr:NUDIX domain-containing protein [Lutimaribacter sp. EGI FJ00013]MCM2562489.1 gamma-glutamylcyclotransferase [Lutimaribacter sp. EGI FJ00013]MCO0613646.1 gamma-glutamylcyclotransferase [Lutimaribacter sp. EGI FJ00015]MCO0636618.1 gamma-glutamylcyclotransferase [Lutimaribacter sp. EGI FJ00014]